MNVLAAWTPPDSTDFDDGPVQRGTVNLGQLLIAVENLHAHVRRSEEAAVKDFQGKAAFPWLFRSFLRNWKAACGYGWITAQQLESQAWRPVAVIRQLWL